MLAPVDNSAMARTAQEHLDELYEQRDLLVDQLGKTSGYQINGREVTRNQVQQRLDWIVKTGIPEAEKRVSGKKGPVRSLVSFRRPR